MSNPESVEESLYGYNHIYIDPGTTVRLGRGGVTWLGEGEDGVKGFPMVECDQ